MTFPAFKRGALTFTRSFSRHVLGGLGGACVPLKGSWGEKKREKEKEKIVRRRRRNISEEGGDGVNWAARVKRKE